MVHVQHGCILGHMSHIVSCGRAVKVLISIAVEKVTLWKLMVRKFLLHILLRFFFSACDAPSTIFLYTDRPSPFFPVLLVLYSMYLVSAFRYENFFASLHLTDVDNRLSFMTSHRVLKINRSPDPVTYAYVLYNGWASKIVDNWNRTCVVWACLSQTNLSAMAPSALTVTNSLSLRTMFGDVDMATQKARAIFGTGVWSPKTYCRHVWGDLCVTDRILEKLVQANNLDFHTTG